MIPVTGSELIDRAVALRRRIMHLITDMPADELRRLIEVGRAITTACADKDVVIPGFP